MKHLWEAALLCTSLTSSAFAVPYPLAATNSTCTKPSQRKAWQDMAVEDKRAYLAANRCILNKPAKLGVYPGAKTRWDELAALHQLLALQIHSTGNFLVYHRYFLHVLDFLMKECGYEGPLSYWDEPRDAGNFSTSPVLDPVTGFGGTGQGPNLCVPNGPFANLTVNIGPGYTAQPRCVNRNITDYFSAECSQAQVEALTSSSKTYDDINLSIYLGPHFAGHEALAMMNADSITSAGDPLFMLHHGWVDKMWADWQAKDPARLSQVSGINTQDPAVGFIEFAQFGLVGIEAQSVLWGKPTAAMLAITPDPQSGDGGGNMTLGHVLSSVGIIPDATAKDVLNTKGGYLCYEYV